MKKDRGFVRKFRQQVLAIVLVTALGVSGGLDERALTVQAAENAPSIQNVQPTEAVQTTENVQSVGEVQSTENVHQTGTVQSTEAAQSTEAVSSTGIELSTESPVMYTITFNSNGGTSIAPQTVVAGEKAMKDKVPDPTKSRYAFAGWYAKDGTLFSFDTPITHDYELTAAWTLATMDTPVITSFKNTKTGRVDASVKPVVDAAGYEFSFCASSAFASKVKIVNSASTKASLSSLLGGNVYVRVRSYAAKASGELVYSAYSSVKKVKVKNAYAGKTTSILDVKNKKTGTVTGSFKEAKGATKYVVQCAKNSNFQSVTEIAPTGTAFSINHLARGNYYFRIKTYWKDPLGRTIKTYGKVMSINVKKAIKEYPASADCVRITYCKAISTSQIRVKATVDQRASSDDNYYYFVMQDSYNNAITVLEKRFKGDVNKEVLDYKVDISGKNKNNLEKRYAIAVRIGGNYQLISKASCVTDVRKASADTSAIVAPKTKKGMQGMEFWLFGGRNLNPNHVFFNVDLVNVISKKGAPNAVAYKYGGKTYYFTDNGLPQLAELCKQNIQVTVQVNMSWKDELSYLTYGQKTNVSIFYALNPSNEKAYRTLEAVFSYIGEYYSGSSGHGYATNWILGNEVNAKTQQNFAPYSVSYEDYVKNYATTFRLFSYGVKRGFGNARAYICLDHSWGYEDNILANEHWTIYSAQTFMSDFNTDLKQQASGIKWNLAFHPYAFPLSIPDFWDRSSANPSNGVEHITMKNLEVMTDFVKNNFGSNTSILLSEVGYSSLYGQDKQAAAIAYTYYKAEFNPMINAVIFRTYSDNAGELAAGLAMGLTEENVASRKEAYNVFRYMDTSMSEKYTNRYLSTIGESSWSSVIPGYSSSKFKTF